MSDDLRVWAARLRHAAPWVLGTLALLWLVGGGRQFWALGDLAFGDALPFSSVGDLWEEYLYSWNPRKPGAAATSAPPAFRAVWAGLTALCFGNTAVAQKIWLLGGVPAAFVAAFLALRHATERALPRLVAALLFAVQPLLYDFFHGGVLNTSWTFAVFWLALSELANLSKRPTAPNILRLAVLVSLMFALLEVMMLFLAPLLVAAALAPVVRPGALLAPARLVRPIGLRAVLLAMAIGLALVLALPSTVSLLASLGGVMASLSGASGSRLQELAATDVAYSYSIWSLPDVLRLGTDLVKQPGVDTHGIGMAGWAYPILAALGLVLARRTERPLAALWAALAGLTIAFIWLTAAGPGRGWFDLFPFLYRFRNPSLPILFLSVAYAPLMALAIAGLGDRAAEVWRRLRPSHWAQRVTGPAVIVAGLAVAGWLGHPLFEGALGKEGDRPFSYYELGGNIRAEADRLRELTDDFRRPFRVAWLPWRLGDGASQFELMFPYAINPAFGAAQTSQSRQFDVLDQIYRSLLEGDGALATRLLAASNVKHVVVNLASPDEVAPTIEYPYFAPALVGDPRAIDALVRQIPSLRLVQEANGVRVYELPEARPFVWSPAGVEVIRSLDEEGPVDRWARWLASPDHAPDRLVVWAHDLSAEQEERLRALPAVVPEARAMAGAPSVGLVRLGARVSNRPTVAAQSC